MESKSAKKGDKIENVDERPDLAWVETVLGEMKSEFNKQLTFADLKTDCGSKLGKNNVNNVLSKKLDSSKAESTKGNNNERKKSSPGQKSGGLKSSPGKSVHSKSGTSKTSNNNNNNKQLSKRVLIVKPGSVKQASTKSTNSSPVTERVSKNASPRKSNVLTGADASSKGNVKKQDRITTSQSPTTTKRGGPSAESADKKNDKSHDVNMVANHLPVSKAVRDKLTVEPVVVTGCNTGGNTAESSGNVNPDSNRTKAVTVSDMINAKSKSVTTSTFNTAAPSTSNSTVTATASTGSTATKTKAAISSADSTLTKTKAAISSADSTPTKTKATSSTGSTTTKTKTKTGTSAAAATAAAAAAAAAAITTTTTTTATAITTTTTTATTVTSSANNVGSTTTAINVINTGISSGSCGASNSIRPATTSCLQAPVVTCSTSPTVPSVTSANALRTSTTTATKPRSETTADLQVTSANTPHVVTTASNSTTTTTTTTTTSNTATSNSSSAARTTASTIANPSDASIIAPSTETVATITVGSTLNTDTTLTVATIVFSATTALASSSTTTSIVATNAHSTSAAIITPITTNVTIATKPTVTAANIRTSASKSSSTFTTSSSTTTSSKIGGECIDSPQTSAAVNTGSTTICRNHVKEDKGNKPLHSVESKIVPITSVAAKPDSGIRMKTKDGIHKNGSHEEISDNSKPVADTPVSSKSVVTSCSTAESNDSFSPEMTTLPKNPDKVASCAQSLPCASDSPEIVTPVCEVPSESDLEASKSAVPKPDVPVSETPSNESVTSVQEQADSVPPLTANLLSQASAEPVLNVQNEDPSLTVEEEFDDCSEKSEEITLLNRSEKVASDAEDNAPRLLITLKPGEAGGDSILSWKGCREVIGNDGVWSLANVETVDDNIENITAKDKRSLRSQVPQKTIPEPEVIGVKRSARRRSRDYHRETVLQSAIARKEKSFSNLVQYDERAAAKNLKSAANRSSRQNMKNSVAKRAAAEAKKLGAKGVKAKNLTSQEQLKNLINLNKARKSDIQTRTVTRAQLCSSYRITTPVYNENSMDICSQKTSNLSMNPSAQTYTKTGKRRYKPYKGLRYSFSSNNVKKTKLTRHQRTLSETDRTNNEIMGRPMVARKSDKLQTLKGFEVDTYTLPAENYSLLRNGSPSAPRSLKNSRVADGNDFKRKRFCYDQSSLSPENRRKKLHITDDSAGELSDDDMSQPIPEVATSSSKGTDGGILCYCQKSTSLFAASQPQEESVMYCQAMDALDEHLIGCAEVVHVKNVSLRRAGVRCPFVLLCEVHRQRLERHMCCPGCGIFCTQGKFVMCSHKHLYHRECQVTKEGVLSCPHCGEVSPPVDSALTLSTLRTPVYLPELKPPRTEPTARMTAKESSRENIIEEREKGMTLPLDKEKLTQLVNTACSMQVVSEQETNTSRSMEETLFIAAKTGNAEKILQALASGIDANHVFEEANMGSALHVAAIEGNLAAVHILLQSGAQIDLMDQDQYTPLILAAQGGHNAIVEYLIKAGASVTLKGGEGMTALHVAAKTGNVEACQYLLSVPNTKNNFVDTVDDGGWTPLVWATENCHADVARFLLKKRADPHIRDAEQNIALHWSAFSGCMDILEMLINYGSEVNCANVHGDTPLHVGARQDEYDCVLMLLSRGARVDVVNAAGNSPLDCCVKRSNECYTAIKLNILLGNVVLNVREPSQKILCNDISRGRETNPIQCVNSEDDEEEPRDYTYVSKNCLTANISIDTAITSVQSCRCLENCSSSRCSCALMSEQCWYDDEGKLVPEFNYTDAPMIFECNQCCSCNQVTCNNRVVQHGFTGRFQLFRTQRRGWGVRTLTAISKGSFVCEYIGEIITDCEADNRDDDTYLFDLDNRRRHSGRNTVHERRNSVELVSSSSNQQEHLEKKRHDGETYCIDARYFGNISRFINHMCAPNLLAVRVFVDHQDVHFPRMAFFANRDIEANEELGFDYGEKFWAVKCKSFTCSCGAENCKYSESTFKKTLNLSGASEQ